MYMISCATNSLPGELINHEMMTLFMDESESDHTILRFHWKGIKSDNSFDDRGSLLINPFFAAFLDQQCNETCEHSCPVCTSKSLMVGPLPIEKETGSVVIDHRPFVHQNRYVVYIFQDNQCSGKDLAVAHFQFRSWNENQVVKSHHERKMPKSVALVVHAVQFLFLVTLIHCILKFTFHLTDLNSDESCDDEMSEEDTETTNNTNLDIQNQTLSMPYSQVQGDANNIIPIYTQNTIDPQMLRSEIH